MSENKRKLEPLETVVGALTAKMPDGSFQTFQVLYGGALYPWVNGKMQYVKQDTYKNILRDFLNTEEGRQYEVPTETEIMQVRTEILNNDRLGLYKLTNAEDDVNSQEENSEASQAQEKLETETNDNNVSESLATEANENDDSYEENIADAQEDVAEEQETYDGNDESSLDEDKQYDEDSDYEDEDEEDGIDYDELMRVIRIVAVNSSELIELNKNQVTSMTELASEIKKQTSEIKKTRRIEQATLIMIILFGLLIPTLYYFAKLYGFII